MDPPRRPDVPHPPPREQVDAPAATGSPVAATAAATFDGGVVTSDEAGTIETRPMLEDEEDKEDDEAEWTGDPNNRPIWKFPVVSRVRTSECTMFNSPQLQMWEASH